MDSNPLRHLEFFSVPNNQVRAFQDAFTMSALLLSTGAAANPDQTVNPVDQSFNLAGASSAQSSTNWDGSASLIMDAGASDSPSTTPTGLFLDSFAQTVVSTVGAPSRPIMPTRASKTREGHERKRPKLSTNATPFDNVDYWIQFDNDESLTDIPEGGAVTSLESRGKGKAPAQRSVVAAIFPPIVWRDRCELNGSWWLTCAPDRRPWQELRQACRQPQ
jgi:hypothetical protein